MTFFIQNVPHWRLFSGVLWAKRAGYTNTLPLSMTPSGIGKTVLVQKHWFEARCYGDGTMISLINSPSLERYTKGWELFVHANISVLRVFVFLRLVCMYACWCSHILRCFSPSHNLHDLSALHLPSTALKSQMKKPRCHLRTTHFFKCVSLSRHNGCCYFTLSLSFLLILV